MAGVKGRSGGARKGTGGARAGAGRKKKAATTESANVPVLIEGEDTLKLLQDVAFGRVEATALQVRAAIAAVQYTHMKKGDGGVKDGKNAAAGRVSAGKFAPAVGPKLVVSNR